MRAAMRTPVSGSNLPDRFHMPSLSTHDRIRALRRCRSNRSTPSPSCNRFVSIANRRANSSTLPALATSASASARASSSPRWAVSSCLDARVTASMWPLVIAPSPNAPANFGVAPNVADRSVDLAACPNDCFDALAMRCSGNESTSARRATRPACWASHHACTSRTATRPVSISSAPAARSDRTTAMRSTRSITPPISIRQP
jgi:hypothetical protein